MSVHDKERKLVPPLCPTKQGHDLEQGDDSVALNAATRDALSQAGGTREPNIATIPGQLSSLQRLAGNSAVNQLLRRGKEEEESPVKDVVDRSGGRPLDPGLRSEMESSFGHDFSDVRIHADAKAADSARSIGARAYTVGNDVVLGSGERDLDGPTGRHTLAHELAHVVQQRSGPVAGSPGPGGIKISNPADRFEQEATRVAARVSAGHPAGMDGSPRKDAGREAAAVQRVRTEVSDKEEVEAPKRNKDEEPGGYREHLKKSVGGNPLVVKVAIGGSAYDAWATHTSNKGRIATGGQRDNWIRQDQPKLFKKTGLTWYMKVDSGRGPNLAFAGPTSKETKGWKGKSYLTLMRGSEDTGSNSIGKLVEGVPKIIKNIVANEFTAAAKKNQPYNGVILLIKAHSRGAVAGSQVAATLRKQKPKWHIELVLFEPVPGPSHDPKKPGNPNTEINLSRAGLDRFTLVYSVASGYNDGKILGVLDSPKWFTPQQVVGAQTIIISTQSHSAGLTAGFRYGDAVYVGSRLNLLEPGVYVDLNKTGENQIPLVKVATREQANEALATAVAVREREGEGIEGKSDTPDEDRIRRISVVLKKWHDAAERA